MSGSAGEATLDLHVGRIETENDGEIVVGVDSPSTPRIVRRLRFVRSETARTAVSTCLRR